MPRTNKKTRIRGLPPRLQLQQKDAATGSFPSNVRVVSDNRTGEYGVLFDDRNTVNFTSHSLTTMADVSNSIIAYWKFNEPTVVSASSGNHRFDYLPTSFAAGADLGASSSSLTMFVTGSSINAVSPNTEDLPWHGNAQGRLDASLDIKGVNSGPNYSVISVVSASFFNFSTGSVTVDKPFSISAWIKFTGSAPAANYIMRKVSATGTLFEWSFSVIAGALSFAMYDQTVGNRIVATAASSNAIGSGYWMHVVGTYDGSGSQAGINLYHNGVLDSGATKTMVGAYTQMQNTTSPIVVGHDLLTSPVFAFDGYIAEIAVFNKELTATQVRKIYNTRTSIAAYAIDGISLGIGLDPQSKFLQNTEQFTNIFTNGKVVKGIGDSVATFTPGQDLTPFRENDNPALDGLSSTSSFYAVGSPVSLVGEGFDQPLWSKTKIEIQLPVASGSSPNRIITYISGGHNETLNSDPASGSVSKVIGVPSPTTGGFVGLSYPMSYYNFAAQRWEGTGRGEAYCYTGTFRNRAGSSDNIPFYTTMCVGFSQGLVCQQEGINDTGISGAFEYMAGAGQPISNFGFPFDARYHATSSQLLKMNNFINEPIVVEKIVVDFSGSFEFSSTNYTTGTIVPTVNSVISSAFPGAINNFFILVQRRPYSFRTSLGVEAGTSFANDTVLNSSVPTQVTLSNASGRTQIETVRELLTYGGVSSFAANTPTMVTRQGNVGSGLIINATLSTKNPKQLMTRDVVFESSQSMVANLTPLNWSGSFRMEIESRNPTRVFDLFGIVEYGNDPVIASMDTKFDFGGRNGLGVTFPSGRDLVSPIANIEIEALATNGRTNKTVSLANSNSHFRFGGYILRPEDSLIFGWQQPMPMTLTVDFSSRHVNDGLFSSITFNGAKVTIYGSLLREGKEYHDTLNQLLTSDTVHEVIE